MIPIIVAAARGLAGGLAKKTVKTLAKKSAKKKIKNTQDVKGSDLRPEKREEESGEIEQEQLKIIEKDNDKLISKAEIAQEKSESRIVKTEEEINQIEDSLENKENPDYKTDPELIKIEKEKLEILRDQLTIQKEQLEEQKEAEYEREHERKTSLKEKAKSMAIKVKDGAKAGMGGVVDDVKKNKGLLTKLMGGAALIAAFWPIIKEKIGSFVEWIADNIPDLIKGVWESVKEMASGIMDMVVKYGPDLIQNVINGLAEVASSLLDGIIKYGPQVLTMLIDGVKTLAEKVLSGIVEYGPQVGMMLWGGFKGLISAVFPLMVEYIPKILSMIWNGVNVIINDVVNVIKEYGPQVWEMVKKGLTSAVNWVTKKASSFGKEIWSSIKVEFNTLVELIKDKISNLGADISQYIYDATNGLMGSKKMDDKTSADLIKASSGNTEAFLEKVESYGIIDESDISGVNSSITDKEKLRSLPPEVIKALLKSNDFSDEDEKLFQDILDGKVGPANQTSKNPVAEMVEVHKKQYAKGGHTGDGDSKEIAGVVHYNEFVLSEKMLNEIEDAKTEGEKNALIEKAAVGKGKNAIEAIRKLIKRGEASGHSVTINGVTVMLTNAQKEEYDKLAQETEDEYELMDKEETFVKNVARGNHVDKNKNKVRYASEPSKPANQTNISKPSTSSLVTKEKVVDTIDALDKASLSAAQSGLITLGLIDENGNLAGQTDSEKGIDTSTMLGNQTSVTDISSMIVPQVANGAKKVGNISKSGLDKVKGFFNKNKEDKKEPTLVKPKAKEPKEVEKYSVQPGYTLSQLAQTHKISLTDLMSWNPEIKDQDKILIGEKINLTDPNKAKAQVQPTSDKTELTKATEDTKNETELVKVEKDRAKAKNETGMGKEAKKEAGSETTKANDKLTKMVKEDTSKEPKLFGVAAKQAEDYKHRFDILDEREEQYKKVSATLEGKTDAESIEKKKKIDEQIEKIGKIKEKINNGDKISKIDAEIKKSKQELKTLDEKEKGIKEQLKKYEKQKSLEAKEKVEELKKQQEGIEKERNKHKENIDKKNTSIDKLGRTTKGDDKFAKELKKDKNGDGEVTGKEKVEAFMQEADETSLLATQNALAAVGLIDENGDIAGQTDSEKGISTSAMLRNQTSTSDVAAAGIDGISNMVGRASLLEKGASFLGMDSAKGMGDTVKGAMGTAASGTKNFFGIGDGSSKTGLEMGKDLAGKAAAGIGSFFGGNKEEKTEASIGTNKAMDIVQPESMAEVKKNSNKAEGLNKPSVEKVEVSKARPANVDVGESTKNLAGKTAAPKVEKTEPVVNNNTTVVQQPAPAPSQISLDNSDFNDNTLSLVGGII